VRETGRRNLRRSAVILARVLGFIEIADLISGSKTSVGELVRKITERYAFEKFPRTFEELDLGKGVEFNEGSSEFGGIRKFIIYDTLLVVETRTSTAVSRSILEEILVWGSEELGLNYKPNSIKRYGYISDVTFYSEAPLIDLPPAMVNIAARVSRELSDIWQEPVKYEPLNFNLGHDPTARKNPIAPFSIARRSEARFSENKYFSEAPLPTDKHWEILEQYEQDILAGRKGGLA
jgi:hypothetical protein